MQSGLKEITSCEVCGNDRLKSVLDLGMHPMCDDLVEVGNDRVCREYPIDILFCEQCITAHQRFQIPKRELFPKTYHYRSRFTADVLNGMKGLVGSCADRFGSLQGKLVLDIGCNDGSLLDFFRDAGARTIGIEPTGAARDAAAKGHDVFDDYLSPQIAEAVCARHGKPDFVTFTNVFAHIDNLRDVLASLSRMIGPQTVLVIENHYLGAVLAHGQFDTFYHEHPRTYSFRSFAEIAKSLKVSVIDAEFPSRYGGNIRVFLGSRAGAVFDSSAVDAVERNFASDFTKLRENLGAWLQRKKALIAEMVAEHGRLRAKAFPGRAAILVKLLDLDEKTVLAVYEKPGSLKIGHYLPGTRIPILSDDDLFALPDQTLPIINFAWHISGEIRNYLQLNGYSGQVVDVLANSDFKAD
jgi:SAM-dependent methyltransferase